MKYLLTAISIGFIFTAAAQRPQLEKLWETDTVIAIPESVLPDVKNKVLYVSLIDGDAWAADSKGGVAKLSMDGKKYDSTWITGLNAPKGLGHYRNRLYVADISEIVVIDISKGKVEKKIPVEGAEGFNDIAVDNNGVVFVSDSKTGRIWRIENDIPSMYLENIKGANGLLCVKNDLVFAEGKSLMKADAQKHLTKITEVPQGIDGIESVGNGDFVVSSWVGYIYYVNAGGQTETVLDTHLDKKNTADIGYDKTKKIVYVPSFNAKTIAAYQLR